MNQPIPDRTIKVMVVDDSAFMRTALSRMIESDPQLKVVAAAVDGQQALDLLEEVDPDVITLDVEMPRLNGLETLKRIMTTSPRPTIMISSLTQEGALMTFEALDLGAFDYIPKQLSYVSLDIVKIKQELVAKVRAAAATKPAMQRKSFHCDIAREAPKPQVWRFPVPEGICLGCSTGGPKALQQILPLLPADLSCGLLIVQHMPPGFTGPFAARLNGFCKVRVKEAEPDDWVDPGTVLIAPAGWQMSVYRRTHSRYAVRVSKTPLGTLHIPSVDVLMLSAAECLKAHTMGVILTGMGNDGEAGIKAIYDAGGYTIGQDEATCTVYGMPRACALAGTLRRVVPLMSVPGELVAATRSLAIK